ncbi:hypothetical protein ACVJGD_004308 [Bradyrhizobium sp. USDA 10063]
MGATHFLMKRLRNVAAEMALHVLAYNLTRVMNIVGKPSLIAAKSATGRLLDDPTRKHWRPATIVDPGRFQAIHFHTAKIRSRR